MSELINSLTTDENAKLMEHGCNNLLKNHVSYGAVGQGCNSTTETCDKTTMLREYDPECLLTNADNLDIIGRGAFGTVRRCLLRCAGGHNVADSVAVKCLKVISSKNVMKLKKEVLIQFEFKHDNVLKLFGFTSWQLHDDMYICGLILEDIKCKNLQDLLQLKESAIIDGQENLKLVPIDWKIRFRIFLQICCGLAYLHAHEGVMKKQCVHMDLKPENILLTEKMTAKLADFGSLQIINATGTDISHDGLQYTVLYAAPELMKNLSNTVPQCSMDVYSYSMIGYEILTRTEVFQPIYNMAITMDAIRHGQKPNLSMLKDVESQLKETRNFEDYKIFQKMKSTMEECWEYLPNNRPTILHVWKSLVAFAKSENPYETDVKEHVTYLANLQKMKTLQNDYERVPLNHCTEYANAFFNNGCISNGRLFQPPSNSSSTLIEVAVNSTAYQNANNHSTIGDVRNESDMSQTNFNEMNFVQSMFCSHSCTTCLKYCGVPLVLTIVVLVIIVVFIRG